MLVIAVLMLEVFISFMLICICSSLVSVRRCARRAERNFLRLSHCWMTCNVSKPWHFDVNVTAAMLETVSALKVMSRLLQSYAVWPTVKKCLLYPGVRCWCIRQVRIERLQSAHFCVDSRGKFRVFRKIYGPQNIRKTDARVAWAYQIVQFTSYTTHTVTRRSWIRFLS